MVRSGNEKGNGWDNGSSNKVKGDRSSSQLEGMVEISSPSVLSKDGVINVWNSSSRLIVKKAMSFETLTNDPISKRSVGDSLNRCRDGNFCPTRGYPIRPDLNGPDFTRSN